MAQKKRGAFIVLEGIDRCGKTSQSSLLLKALTGDNVNAVARRFPNRTTSTGQVINSYLKNSTELNDQVIHLLYSANRWEAVDELRSLLQQGTTVVCDRYAYSGVAFSAAKGLDLEWCKNPDRGLVAPDCVIYLDLSVEQSKKRGQFGDERYEKEEFQRKVCAMYSKLQDSSWRVVDADRTVEEVHREMLAIVRDTIASVQSKDDDKMQTLWT